ncbi:cytochrome b/b6 domain-containing protein [Nocardia concava]|uniref:cytochrome b/b6 domain-containing protein n=1 Tax=Nocardia concava TaxID=257281 RepID=UPI00030DB857|nr:cytochrome b/b6 domain-containing protein [Nocardia concava]
MTPTEPQPGGHRIRRFTPAERMIHRTTGFLMLLCTTTAAFLYFAPLSLLIGHRNILVFLHEWSGILLPTPTLLGLLSPSFRADLRRLNRFASYDRHWLRAVARRQTTPTDRPAGKFNAGQKLYAGWISGAILVMLSTGLLMWFIHLLPEISRTSAIFVHDVLAWAIAAVLIAHILKAHQDPEARHGMRTGYVSHPWATREHPHWLPQTRRPKTADTVDEVFGE